MEGCSEKGLAGSFLGDAEEERELMLQGNEAAAGIARKTSAGVVSRIGTRGWVVVLIASAVVAALLLLFRPTSTSSVHGPSTENYLKLNLVRERHDEHHHHGHHKHEHHSRRRPKNEHVHRRRRVARITEENQHLRCPGSVPIKNHGHLSLLNAGLANEPNAERNGNFSVRVLGEKRVSAGMWGRAYMAESCRSGLINNTQYAALKLMGKTLQWTTDLSAAKCGCNAALYLVAMQQNELSGECQDFYCDANEVCGVRCAEVDLMEANQHAFRSTLHAKTDGKGFGAGFGGSGLRAFKPGEYRPNGRCVDTRRPFHVRAHIFEHGMVVKLFQFKHCVLRIKVKGYHKMRPVREALLRGMTPVVSYWGDPHMYWLDGDICKKEHVKYCGEKVQFWNFKVIE